MTAVVSLSLVLWIAFSLFVATVLLLTFRYIPNDRVGIVEKLWSPRVGDERAHRPERRGRLPARAAARWLHLLMPFQYRVHKMPLVTIPQGKIGYVFARDGQPLPPTQTLACNVTADDFQDVAAFLRAAASAARSARSCARAPTRSTSRSSSSSRASASTSCRSTRTEADDLQADGAGHRRARRLRAGRDQGRRRRHRHRHRARRPVAPGRRDHRADVGDDAGDAGAYHNNFQDPETFLPPAACAAASCRCSSRARTTSTACSRRSR